MGKLSELLVLCSGLYVFATTPLRKKETKRKKIEQKGDVRLFINIYFHFTVTGLCVGIGFGLSQKIYEDVKSVVKEPGAYYVY